MSDLQYGWVCPKCGSVYSPLVMQCGTCANSGLQRFTSMDTQTCPSCGCPRDAAPKTGCPIAFHYGGYCDAR